MKVYKNCKVTFISDENEFYLTPYLKLNHTSITIGLSQNVTLFCAKAHCVPSLMPQAKAMWQ
jgi:hypothetical protein